MQEVKRYPGSKPFTLSERGIFFGRNEDIEDLYHFIAVEKLSVLYGKSGLGKTSLLNAGVMPKLQEEKTYLPIEIRFNAYRENSFRPLTIFRRKIAFKGDGTSILDQVDPEASTLWHHLKNRDLTLPEDGYQFLVFDQFEELFTYPNGVEDFAEELGKLLTSKMPPEFMARLRSKLKDDPDFLSDEDWAFLKSPIKLKVLLSIRSDKMSLLNRLATYIPNILRDCYELKPLSNSQAIDAIVEPAKLKGDFASPPFSYHKDTLDKIMTYLTKNNKKHVESFQLQILCQYVEENIVLERSDYDISVEDLGDLEKIYQNYYDYHIETLESVSDQLASRRLIEEGLIFEAEQRRLTLYQGIIKKKFGVNKKLLQKLVNTHIIRAIPIPDEENSFSYEISHDTLVAPILKSKERRVRAEEREKQRLLDQKKAEEKAQAFKKQRKRIITIGASILATIVGLIWALAYTNNLRSEAVVAKGNAETTGRLIIQALQMKDDATLAMRLAQSAFEIANQSEDYLELLGQFASENLFYEQVYHHSEGVGSVDISMNQVATGSDDGYVRIWNLDGTQEHVLRGHHSEVKAVKFSPETEDSNGGRHVGKYLLSSAKDGSVIAWRTEDGKKMGEVKHDFGVYAIAFSPDGHQVISADKRGYVKMWTVREDSVQILFDKRPVNSFVLAACFSESGNNIFLGGVDERITILDRSGIKRGAHNCPAAVNCLAMDKNDQYIFAGLANNEIHRISLKGSILRFAGADDPFLMHDADISFISVSPTGDSIISGANNKIAKLWRINAKTGEYEMLKELRGHTGFLRFGGFSPDGSFIATSSDDRTAKIWNLNQGLEAERSAFDPDNVTEYKLIGDGGGGYFNQYILNKEGNINRINASLVADTFTFRSGNKKFEDFSIDRTNEAAQYLAGVREDGKILFFTHFPAQNSLTTDTLKTGLEEISSVKVKTLVFKSTSNQGVITGVPKIEYSTQLLVGAPGKVLRYELNEEGGLFFKDTLSFDEADNADLLDIMHDEDRLIVLAASRNSAQIKTWEIMDNGQVEMKQTRQRKPGMNQAYFSVDGKYIFTASDDQMAFRFDRFTLEENAFYEGHSGKVKHIIQGFEPYYIKGENSALSREYVVTAGEDGLIIFWDNANTELYRYDSGDELILDLAFHNEARSYVYSTGDGKFMQRASFLPGLNKDVYTLSYTQKEVYELPKEVQSTVLSDEDKKEYVYFLLGKINAVKEGSSTSPGELNENFENAIGILSPVGPNDSLDVAMIYALRIELSLLGYLGTEINLNNLEAFHDSVEKYDELRAKGLAPQLIAAYLLEDDVEMVQEKWKENVSQESIEAKTSESIDLLSDLSTINKQLKRTKNASKTEKIDQFIPVKFEQLQKALLEAEMETKKSRNKTTSSDAPANESKKKDTLLYNQETVTTFRRIATEQRKQSFGKYETYEADRYLFERVRDVGKEYAEKMGLDKMLEEAIVNVYGESYKGIAGYISTDFSLYHAQLYNVNLPKAREIFTEPGVTQLSRNRSNIKAYNKRLLRTIRPSLLAYLDYWESHGGKELQGEKTEWRKIMSAVP